MTERLDKVFEVLKSAQMELLLLGYDIVDSAEAEGKITFEKANELRAQIDAKLPVQPAGIGEAE